MTKQHHIPSLFQVREWREEAVRRQYTCDEADEYIAEQSAQWSADKELLACGNYLKQCAAWEEEDVIEFYNYRRPKPPSLKKQALEHLEQLHANAYSMGMGFDPSIIRRALEQLDD
jgi:hypothetical protein